MGARRYREMCLVLHRGVVVVVVGGDRGIVGVDNCFMATGVVGGNGGGVGSWVWIIASWQRGCWGVVGIAGLYFGFMATRWRPPN